LGPNLLQTDRDAPGWPGSPQTIIQYTQFSPLVNPLFPVSSTFPHPSASIPPPVHIALRAGCKSPGRSALTCHTFSNLANLSETTRLAICFLPMPAPSIKRPEILSLGNHAQALGVLEKIAGGSDLHWYHEAVHAVAREWYQLSSHHMRAGRQLLSRPRNWRAVVSRSYYAAYNASRAVRYFVKGAVAFDSKDHQLVGDLPTDFPDAASWATFVNELRRDRNIADYEPWKDVRTKLSDSPSSSLNRVEKFISVARLYMRNRGMKI
jgi:hypothetical protein